MSHLYFFQALWMLFMLRVVLHDHCLKTSIVFVLDSGGGNNSPELSPPLLWCPGLCCWGGSSSQPLQPCPGPSDLDTTWSPCPILPTPCPILLRCLSNAYEQTEPFIGSPTLNTILGCHTSATAGVCRRRSGEGRRPWWEETPLPWRRLQHASPCLVR